MNFKDLEFKDQSNFSTIQALVHFPNGYGASVVRGPFTYGGPAGLYEIAVLKGKHICYDTPVTSDVLGHLSESDVEEVLRQIEALKESEEK